MSFFGTDKNWFSAGSETDAELIRVLLEPIIMVRRIRNSLLSISTAVPPEILGDIFARVVTRNRDYPLLFDAPDFFDRFKLERGSYNFLLVCHHWFEIASNTPELCRGFWGDTLQDWDERRRHTAATAPVHLLLRGSTSSEKNLEDLGKALKIRITQDKIREIHLMDNDPKSLTFVLSSLTPNSEDLQEKHVESIVLRSKTGIPSDLSKFFAGLRLPNLRNLQINGKLQEPLWDHLASRTARLTTLSLNFTHPLPLPSASQLISILASNPELRDLELMYAALPDTFGGLEVRVPLPNLRRIVLAGNYSTVFGLLDRLEFPATWDFMFLCVSGFTEEDIPQTLGPRIRDHLQRNPRFKNTLGVALFPGSIVIHGGHGGGFPVQLDSCRLESSHGKFVVSLGDEDPDLVVNSTYDLMAFISRERVVHLEVMDPMEVPEDLLAGMPNIETLWLDGAEPSYIFLQPVPHGPYPSTKLPSLRFLHLKNVTANDDGWRSLMGWLTHQTSDYRAISLLVSGSSHMSVEVEGEMRKLFEKFDYERSPEGPSGPSVRWLG